MRRVSTSASRGEETITKWRSAACFQQDIKGRRRPNHAASLPSSFLGVRLIRNFRRPSSFRVCFSSSAHALCLYTRLLVSVQTAVSKTHIPSISTSTKNTKIKSNSSFIYLFYFSFSMISLSRLLSLVPADVGWPSTYLIHSTWYRAQDVDRWNDTKRSSEKRTTRLAHSRL